MDMDLDFECDQKHIIDIDGFVEAGKQFDFANFNVFYTVCPNVDSIFFVWTKWSENKFTIFVCETMRQFVILKNLSFFGKNCLVLR